MVQPQMTRELVGLEVVLASVDISSSCATHSLSRKKSQIPNAAEENCLPPMQASNNTHIDEKATPFYLCSPPRDISELITLSDASQNPLECDAISIIYEATS